MNLFKYYNHYLITIEVFDPCITLDKIKNNGIKIYNFKKIDEYHYSLIIKKQDYIILKKLFISTKLERKIGFINIFKKNILRISTIISIICSLFLFSFMNNLIMGININGDSSSLIEVINKKLIEKNIIKYSIKKSNEELSIIEKEIAIELYDLIEWIEIKNQGLNVNVRFIKRRDSFNIESTKKGLYSKKAGIIKSFKLEKGIKCVEVNDYVFPGQLLVNGYLLDSNEKEIFIGAIGQVYAYTWLNLVARTEVSNNYDELDVYLKLKEIIDQKVDKELTGNDEYIENSKLLKFEIKNGIAILNMHFTLVEDITR